MEAFCTAHDSQPQAGWSSLLDTVIHDGRLRAVPDEYHQWLLATQPRPSELDRATSRIGRVEIPSDDQRVHSGVQPPARLVGGCGGVGQDPDLRPARAVPGRRLLLRSGGNRSVGAPGGRGPSGADDAPGGQRWDLGGDQRRPGPGHRRIRRLPRPGRPARAPGPLTESSPTCRTIPTPTSSTATRICSSPDGRRREPFLKPGWSPETLLSFNYITHLVLARRELVPSRSADCVPGSTAHRITTCSCGSANVPTPSATSTMSSTPGGSRRHRPRCCVGQTDRSRRHGGGGGRRPAPSGNRRSRHPGKLRGRRGRPLRPARTRRRRR